MEGIDYADKKVIQGREEERVGAGRERVSERITIGFSKKKERSGVL